MKPKYKLVRVENGQDASQRPCAFFATADGCRSGDSCRFAHVLPQATSTKAAAGGGKDMVVSSESSDNESLDVGTTRQQVSEPPVAKKKGKNKEKAVDSNPETTKLVVASKPETSKVDSTPPPPAEEDDPFIRASLANKPGQKRPKDVFAQSKKQKRQKVAPTVNSDNDNDGNWVPVEPPATSTPKVKTKATTKQTKSAPPKPPPAIDFRSLQLPVASFRIPGYEEKPAESTPEPVVDATPPPLTVPLPTSTPVGRKWLDVVKKTRAHPRYEGQYNMQKFKDQDSQIGYPAGSWVKTPPFDKTKANNPQAIAIDCEMCQTTNPATGNSDGHALCRVSVVDVETNEVLLDTLVQPDWPVSDYRTWVNGIAKEHLEGVQFTLSHAQAFFTALCSQETVILGHAVHNDLAALRLEHPTVADSANLYKARDSKSATVSLKDVAKQMLDTEMPNTHDSVNDARVSFQCLEHYRLKKGQVDTIVRTPKARLPRSAYSTSNKRSSQQQDEAARRHMDYAEQLFCHRLPKNVVSATQLSTMFVGFASVKPSHVEDITFKGNMGTTHVHFESPAHCELAFGSLEGKAEEDPSGRLQKKIFLRNGGYIRVRKMVYPGEKPESRRKST